MATRAILGSDGRLTPASTFLVVHQALSRDLERFPVAVRDLGQGPDGLRISAFQDHWKGFREILDAHHELEDKVLFPELRELAPGLADLLEVLGTKHADLEGLLDTASRWVEQLPEEVDQAVAALEELAEFLEFHLATEEAHLVSVMLSSLEPPEQAAPPPTSEVAEPGDLSEPSRAGVDEGDASDTDPAGVPLPAGDEMRPAEGTGPTGLDFGSVDPAFGLPWCTDGLDDAAVQALLAGLPERVQAGYAGWRQDYQQNLARWQRDV